MHQTGLTPDEIFQKISKLKDIARKMIHTEVQRENWIETATATITTAQLSCDNFKQPNRFVTVVPKQGWKQQAASKMVPPWSLPAGIHDLL